MAAFAMKELHELAVRFPSIVGEDWMKFKEDIRSNGLREPIVLYEDQVLDGANRQQACFELGIVPTYREFGSRADDGVSPVLFVLSVNLWGRRHLDASQKARVIANFKESLLEQEDVSEETVTEIVKQKCEEIKVSPRLVASVDRVRQAGSHAVADAMERDEIKVSAAEKLITSLPLERHEEALEMVKGGMSAEEAILTVHTHIAEESRHRDPEDALKAWNDELKEWNRKLLSLLGDLPLGPWLRRETRNSIAGQMRRIIAEVNTYQGHVICPLCTGPGCARCFNTGFMPKIDYTHTQTEDVP